MVPASAGELPFQILTTAFFQVFFGLFCGIVIALAGRWFLDHFSFTINGFDAAFVLSIALLSYALPSAIGGNGYLSAYLVGILLGNHPLRNKKGLVSFFDGLTSLMQMMIFFILGLCPFHQRLQLYGFLLLLLLHFSHWLPALRHCPASHSLESAS